MTQETAGVLISVCVGFAHRETKRQEKSDMHKNEMKLQKGNHKCATKKPPQILKVTTLWN